MFLFPIEEIVPESFVHTLAISKGQVKVGISNQHGKGFLTMINLLIEIVAWKGGRIVNIINDLPYLISHRQTCLL